MTKFGVKYPKRTKCGICHETISGSEIYLDHDHKTNKFRGWLCVNCNLNLGWFEKRTKRVLAYWFKILKDKKVKA